MTWRAQNGTQYEVVLSNFNGERLATIDTFVSLQYSKVANDLGSFALALPSDFDVNLLDKDKLISIWRRPLGGEQALDFRGLILQIFEREESTGSYNPVAYGTSLNHLLKRRIVAYAAQTVYTDKTGAADDLMKAIVRENMGALTVDTQRAYNAGFFSVQINRSEGVVTTRAFSYKNVLTLLREVAQTSRTDGVEMFFDIAPVTDTTFEFRTYRVQPGADLRGQLVFSRDFGNLGWAQYNRDWKDFGNFAYCMGTGDGLSREVITAYLTAAEPTSLGRTEISSDARNEGFTAMLYASAAATLQEARALKHFEGEALSVPGSVYGTDWKFGDYVTASFRGRQFDCIIRAVAVSLNQNRQEEVSALLEAYTDG
jgi:hypothetical protein